jgi:hypothetical protein
MPIAQANEVERYDQAALASPHMKQLGLPILALSVSPPVISASPIDHWNY